MSLIPQPSLHFMVRKKVRCSYDRNFKNYSALAHFLMDPLAALLCTTPTPVLHTSGGITLNQMHDHSVFLSSSEHVHKETHVRDDTKYSAYGYSH